eukprot:gene21596-27634_t
MADTIRDLKALKDIYREMTDSINVGEVGLAAELAKTLLDTLKSSSYDQFSALKSIGNNMQKNVLVIRQKSDKSLKRVCSRKFTTTEYESIVLAYLTLDHLTETHRIDCSGRQTASADESYDPRQTDSSSSSSSFYFDSFGCVEGLSQRVTRFQLEDVDTCMHSAAMEYIYASQHKKQKAAAELDFAGAYSTMKFGEMVDLSELPLNVLYRRLSPDVVAPCVIRSCELLADVVHTSYLISQWHSVPFDQRNQDWDYLHRSPIDLRLYERKQSGQQHESDDEDVDEVRSSEEGEAPLGSREGDELVEPYSHDTDLTSEGAAEARSSLSSANRSSSTDFNEATGSLQLKRNFESLKSCPQLSDEATSSIVSSFEDHFARRSADESDSSAKRLMRLNGVKLAMAYQHMSQSRTILWEELLRALVEMLNMLSLSSAVRPEDFLSMTTALNAMVQLGREFCMSESKALQLCLAEKSREYFLHFHLESFQMIRQMVDAESWQSVPVHLAETGGILGMVRANLVRDSCLGGTASKFGEHHVNEDRRKSLMTGANRRPSSMRCSITEQQQHSENVPESDPKAPDVKTMLMLFGSEGNPFHAMTAQSGQQSEQRDDAEDRDLREADAESYWEKFLSSDGADVGSRKAQDRSASMVVTQSALNGLVKYAANEEKTRLTTRPSKHTVCAPDQSRDFQTLMAYLDRKMSEIVNCGAVVSNGGGGSAERDSVSDAGGAAEAGEHYEAVKMATLLRLPAVITFADPTTCFALNERIVAAESCWFVAMILSEIRPSILRLLPERNRGACNQYVDQIQMVAGELRALVYRAVCPQMIKHYSILSLISECSWDTRKLRDAHHEWVDLLVKNCEEVWNYMVLTEDQFAESSALVREQVWLEVCQCAFDLLLDGYSRVRKCSSEGRAAMTMDVFAVHEGLNRTHLCRPPRGKHHLDSYLHMSFLSDEDMMSWIAENWQSFAYRHIAGMVAQTMTSVLSSKKLKDAMAVVDSLYDIDNFVGNAHINGPANPHNSSNNKLANLLLTNKEGKLSNLISSKFRR